MHLGLVADIVVLSTEGQISVSGDKISHPSLGYVSTGICDIVSPLTEICHSGTDTSNIFYYSQVFSGQFCPQWQKNPFRMFFFLPMTSENINAKQSRKVTSSDRFICIVRPPNYITTAIPTPTRKPLWFVNKDDFEVISNFFEIFNQFCIDLKLLSKIASKEGCI